MSKRYQKPRDRHAKKYTADAMKQVKLMYQQHDGKEYPFAQLPEAGQNALQIFYAEQSLGAIDPEAPFRYVVVPTEVLKDAVHSSPELEGYRDFEHYYNWSESDIPDHADVSYALVLREGDVICDGWLRFLDYVRKGVQQIPCVILPDNWRKWVSGFPDNDDEFKDVTLTKVRRCERGWSVTLSDGWSFYVPNDSPVVPEVGMAARFYGRGIGHPVRGLFLAGGKVFYRTEAEYKEHAEIEMYGADAADWLKRWDEGRSVPTIEMSGLGPGYEQALQIAMAEVLRHLLEEKYVARTWVDPAVWKRDRKAIEAAADANERIEALGLSGAQWGAAVSLATAIYQRGPRSIFTDPSVAKRRISVSRTFPTIP